MMQFLRRQTLLQTSLQEAWDFFSNPRNLEKITPPSLGFRIRSKDLPDEIQEGLRVKYTVRPILGIPLTWVSEIIDVHDQSRFVDVQRRGPYALWHHSHIFEQHPEGVLMTDEVRYRLPGGQLGELIMLGKVRKQLDEIFDYRSEVIQREFKNAVVWNG